jgi:hypothetical protein
MGKMIDRPRFLFRQPEQRACELYGGNRSRLLLSNEKAQFSRNFPAASRAAPVSFAEAFERDGALVTIVARHIGTRSSFAGVIVRREKALDFRLAKSRPGWKLVPGEYNAQWYPCRDLTRFLETRSGRT